MITPRPYQDEGVESIFTYFMSGKSGNPVIAMPTASGKSIVIAAFIRRVLMQWPEQRIIVATHVKELIQQNYNKMLDAWPNAPAGIYSAGLNTKDFHHPIIFGGIQSMIKHASKFGHRDLLLVDECHLISGKDNSNYGRFITALKAINPNLKVIGFSATHWRMGHGLISDGPIFTDVCFDLTTFDAFNRLIAEGYLTTLIPKRMKTELDVSNIKIVKGEYDQKESEKAFDKITYKACQELVTEGYERKSWLIFASGLNHAKHIVDILWSLGIEAKAVHSKMPDEERDKILIDFKSMQLRCVVNYGVLTTGFDHPALDMIGMLRATMSSSLWVQMLGRGMRPCIETGKENCLVLDFAGNTKRLGPINDPVIPRKKGEKPGVAPVRICDNCGAYNHARASVCISCGTVFEGLPKIATHASSEELIATSEEPIIASFDVMKVIYNRIQKAGSLPIVKAVYWCNGGLAQHSEILCFEHKGFLRNKAIMWWKNRMPGEAPYSTDEALRFIDQARMPRQILVHTNKKYPEITAAIF